MCCVHIPYLGKKRSQKGKVIKQTYLLKWLCRFRFMNQSIYIRHFLTSTQPKNPDKIITLVVTICDFKLYMSVSNWWCFKESAESWCGFSSAHYILFHFCADHSFPLCTQIDASCLTWEGQQYQGKRAIVEKLAVSTFANLLSYTEVTCMQQVVSGLSEMCSGSVSSCTLETRLNCDMWSLKDG